MRLYLSSAASLALLALAACGGSDTPAPSAPEAAPESAPAATPAAEPEAPAAEAAPAAEPTPAPAAAPEASAPEFAPEFAALPSPYREADYNRGKRTWKLCQSCHMTAEGAGHLVGPNLYGLFDREIGTAEGFAYSDAVLNADFMWTPEQVDHWLENPSTFLRGNRMSFAGVRREADRTAVIAYLMVETGYTPAAEAPAEEAPAE